MNQPSETRTHFAELENWPNPVHSWLKHTRVSFAPGFSDPVIAAFTERMKQEFRLLGHSVSDYPKDNTELIFATARFGEPLNWRSARMFTGRREFGLKHTPVIFSLLHATHAELEDVIRKLSDALELPEPVPGAFDFPGLAPLAYKTLYEQGARGGPVMALTRLLQGQSKSIRIVLLVGDDQIDYAYLIDLVGAHPTITAGDLDYFYRDLALRIVTAMSTREVTNHKVELPPLSRQEWNRSDAPRQMQEAAAALGARKFFTEMVVVSNLVQAPSISASVSDQYSEGCFATWAPDLGGLVATVTGSARPVEKDAITEDDLALITGVREDGSGAIVRHITGKKNDSPSSESVEMMEMDLHLPRIRLDPEWSVENDVPVVRSKLHGHRSVSSFDPTRVEFVPLEPPYYHYPVSCATEAQAKAIVNAFARSEALQTPSDPRQAVFTILPGHGLMLVEKWVAGKNAFQHLYELMDSGAIQIDNHIPQGLLHFKEDPKGRMTLAETQAKWLHQA